VNLVGTWIFRKKIVVRIIPDHAYLFESVVNLFSVRIPIPYELGGSGSGLPVSVSIAYLPYSLRTILDTVLTNLIGIKGYRSKERIQIQAS
jgi:hypothetical protein